MRILKVWDYEYPWDVRTEKVCQALTDIGHEVHLLARNRRREALVEVLPEATVHRMRPWRALGRRLDAASQFPAFVNPRWSRLAFSTARRHAVDLVLVREIPLAPVAIRVAKRLKVPVVLDMAEHYAAMIRDLWDTGTTRFGDVVVRNPRAVDAMERWVLPRVDHTLVVVEESKSRLVREGVDPDRITVVSNTPSLSRVDEYAAIAGERAGRASGGPPAALRLVYLGVMEEARGVALAVEAVASARRAGVPVTLDLIGEGRSLSDFQARATALGLDDDVVRVHGFVEYREALRMVAGMDGGLIPHHASESWENTIPNKLFDYMSLSVPVLSSDVSPVKRVLDACGAGLTFRDRDAADLARLITEFHRDPRRSEMGQRGIAAVRDRYNWDRDAKHLESAIERVMAAAANHT